MDLDDQLIATGLARGDRGACQQLIAKHHRTVYAFLCRMGAAAALAEDLTQETYAKAWLNVARIREASSLRAWLLTIARNELLQSARRSDPRAVSLDDASHVESKHEAAHEQLERHQENARLEVIVRGLDEPFRELIVLHYFHELSLSELAETLSLPLGTAKSRLSRAIEALRNDWSAIEGGESHGQRNSRARSALIA